MVGVVGVDVDVDVDVASFLSCLLVSLVLEEGERQALLLLLWMMVIGDW